MTANLFGAEVCFLPPEGPFIGNSDSYFKCIGSSDDKTLLVAQYEGLTLLLEDKDFVPRRTILLSHGFDEEEVRTFGTLSLFDVLHRSCLLRNNRYLLDKGLENCPSSSKLFTVP